MALLALRLLLVFIQNNMKFWLLYWDDSDMVGIFKDTNRLDIEE
jgi:hypothetical protein